MRCYISYGGKRQGLMGRATFKMDISKAYDRVHWTYLRRVLEKMGFSQHWVNLLMLCITNVQYSISYEQELLGPILSKYGLCQGVRYLHVCIFCVQKNFLRY